MTSRSDRQAPRPKSKRKVMSRSIGKKASFQGRRISPLKSKQASPASEISWESYDSVVSSNEYESSHVSVASSVEDTDAELGDQISEVARVVQDEDGEDCEIHIYESRFDTRGEEVLLRVGSKSQIKIEKNRSQRACLVLTRYYYRGKRVSHSTLRVQSKHIITALKDVIGSYPGEDFCSETVNISEPPRCLFHYRKELRAYTDEAQDPKMKDHVSLCLKYVEKTMSEEITIFEEGLKDPFALQLHLKNLWIVFKPGCLIYEKHDGMEFVSKLQRIAADEDDNELLGWDLWTERVLYNGEKFGHNEKWRWINKFDGRKAVKHLNLFPLVFHPEADRIRHSAEQRGRKYLSLCGVHYCLYNGLAQFPDSSSFYGSRSANIHVQNRIILDPKAYKHFKDGRWDSFVEGVTIDVEDPPELSVEQLIICTHEMHGYALESKKWGIFNIECVEDIQFNSEAFQGLMFEENKKILIRSLVTQHGKENDDFDDLIKGKGKGLIFLLYGPPGVGKTLTAESIADLTKRPLFTINSGDVIGKGNAETALTSILRLATSWNAVVLLDEADVFMQKRNLATPTANELVAVLLRVIEYFEGILFLTSNRPASIDPAFRSRIHLALSYPPLSSSARRQLWEHWLVDTSSGQRPAWLREDVMQKLANKHVNGRDIKNIMRVAHTLARSDKRGIEPSDVFQALEAHEQFQADFEEGAEKEGSPVESKTLDLRSRCVKLRAFILVIFGYFRRLLCAYFYKWLKE